MSNITHAAQVVITGGGIAGLWCLRRLLDRGYDAWLLEADAIGAGQTLGAQGILHGGVKYGLDGTSRDIAQLLRSQPGRWLDCFHADGELDLSTARVNSPCQHLWAADTWLARAGATVGARAMQGEVKKLERADWPGALREGGHSGTVYQLEETVIDTRSVCKALAAPVRQRILHGCVDDFVIDADGAGTLVCGDVRLRAGAFVFTAATGNELAAERLGLGKGVTQRRPLKMIMARGPLPALFGHCVTISPKPVLTVTTHVAQGIPVWYMGGGVAEDGAAMDTPTAIRHTIEQLTRIFPAMKWSGIEWAAWDVDRAEPAAGSRLPDGPALISSGCAALCWPTKLVYAPALADKVEAFIAGRCQPGPAGSTAPPLAQAIHGSYPWEVASWT